MSKTRYTGVTKDDKTGKYTYYFKAGVDLATGKPYQERRRGFQTAKEAFEARTRALNKVQQQGSISILNGLLNSLWKKFLFQITTLQQVQISNTDVKLFSMNLSNTLVRKKLEKLLLMM